MKIERAGKEYEFTYEELAEAHEELLVAFMSSELMSSFGCNAVEAQQLGKKAYELYSKGNGMTEYECIESAYDQRE